LATVLDLYSRRLLVCPTSEHPDAQLACDAIKIARRGARRAREHRRSDLSQRPRLRPPTESAVYTSTAFTVLCKEKLGISQSMGRVGSCFDNTAAQSFFSTLEHEMLPRHHFATRADAQAVVTTWCHEFYNNRRRHTAARFLPPTEYEKITADQPAAA
jgi:putative transposase